MKWKKIDLTCFLEHSELFHFHPGCSFYRSKRSVKETGFSHWWAYTPYTNHCENGQILHMHTLLTYGLPCPAERTEVCTESKLCLTLTVLRVFVIPLNIKPLLAQLHWYGCFCRYRFAGKWWYLIHRNLSKLPCFTPCETMKHRNKNNQYKNYTKGAESQLPKQIKV